MTQGISSGGQITLKAFQSPAEEFSTLVHEMAHELMHRDKTNMPLDKKVRETEAEAVAFVACHGIGLEVKTASSDYIQLYEGDRKTLMRSLNRIQRTASEILRAIIPEVQAKVQPTGCHANLAEAA